MKKSFESIHSSILLKTAFSSSNLNHHRLNPRLQKAFYSFHPSQNLNSPSSVSPKLSVIHNSDLSLTLDCETLEISNLRLAYVWLRDACQAHHSIHPETHQKLFKSSDIPSDIHPISTQLLHLPQTNQFKLRLRWSHSLLHSSSQEFSTFDLLDLKTRSSHSNFNNHRHQLDYLQPLLWIDSYPPIHSSSSLFIDHQVFLQHPRLQFITLKNLNQLGLVLFEKMSGTSNAQRGELDHLIQTWALEPRKTFYGDYWDVKSMGQDATN